MDKKEMRSFLEWVNSHLGSKLRLSLKQAGKLLSVTESLMQENEDLESALKATQSELRISNLLVDKLDIQKSQIIREHEAIKQTLSDAKFTPHFIPSPPSIAQPTQFDLAKAEPGQKILIELCEDDYWQDLSLEGLKTQSIKTTILAVIDDCLCIKVYPRVHGVYAFRKIGGPIEFGSNVFVQRTETDGIFGLRGTCYNQNNEKEELDLVLCKVSLL